MAEGLTSAAWLTAHATFWSTPQGAGDVQTQVASKLTRRGWVNPVVSVSSNGTDAIPGLLVLDVLGLDPPHPAEQTATVRVLATTPGGSQAKLDSDVSAAFAGDDLRGALSEEGAELLSQVVEPTGEDLANLAKRGLQKGANLLRKALDAAGDAVGKALPWWVWAIAGVVVLAVLFPYVAPLIGLVRRKE